MESLSIIGETKNPVKRIRFDYSKRFCGKIKKNMAIVSKEKELETKLKEMRRRELKEKGIEPQESVAPPSQEKKSAKETKLGQITLESQKIDLLEKEIGNISELKDKLAKTAVTETLELLFAGAISARASDIHLEPEEKDIRLRFRIDGVLKDVLNLNKSEYPAVLNRLKLTAGLKINVHDAPQDGRFTLKRTESDIEVRVSALPGAYGESVVMRLLDPRTLKKNLEELGIGETLLEEIKKQLKKTTGAILTTGPTGSGKTTTLYAFINFVNKPGVKIVTIEDPIEYHIEGVSQTQVEPEKGYDFSNGLRSIVRQDPDVILVGEIRDSETAETAMHAALTGHLVFSTLHTNDAAGTIPRLIDIGTKPQVIAPAINLIMAQRLVRKLCPECKEKTKATAEESEKIKKVLETYKSNRTNWSDKIEIYQAKGCEKCNFSGYMGRIGVFEAFAVDEEIEKLILKSPSISEIRDLLRKKGLVTMLQDSYLKILEGITDFKEVERVLGE